MPQPVTGSRLLKEAAPRDLGHCIWMLVPVGIKQQPSRCIGPQGRVLCERLRCGTGSKNNTTTKRRRAAARALLSLCVTASATNDLLDVPPVLLCVGSSVCAPLFTGKEPTLSTHTVHSSTLCRRGNSSCCDGPNSQRPLPLLTDKEAPTTHDLLLLLLLAVTLLASG